MGENMARGALNATLANSAELMAQLNGLEDKSEKAIKATINQLRNRAPGWVGQEVANVYGIKKAEIKAAGGKKSAGSISLGGYTVDSLYLEYKGRVLTPTHFKMKPKERKSKGYEVSAEIFKGQRKSLGHNVFLGQSGDSGTPSIPFKRVGRSRLPIEAVKTLSIPQMITNKEVNQAIYARISEEAEKVLKNQISRFSK
jgi:hypothetical protein